ncbi:MAG: PIN domain nuclease [Geodermatophilaceae bacterium]|nr:PIN domain nuclease [Geodermatophilaceae bacterium]
MAVARYLADTSVWGRLHRPTVAARFSPLVEAGLVATCGVIDLEMLYSCRSGQEHRLVRAQRGGLEWLAMPDEVWDRAMTVQGGLAARGNHRAASLPDLLIAATAERHAVTVLHYDGDYDLIARVTGQLAEWVVPRGSA